MRTRTEVVRTRLTPDEHAQLEAQAQEAGITIAEYLRNLIVAASSSLLRDLGVRVEDCERRIMRIECHLAVRVLEGQ
jgi:hypothetical protein